MVFQAGIADKFTSLMARPGQDPNDDTPWYIKYGARVVGIVGAFFCVLFGLWNILGILLADVKCMVSGVIQILLGFIVMGVEAPFCCMFIDFVQTAAEKVDQKPLYYRAAGYCLFAILPVILCPGLGSIFACGLVFGCGTLYGMMSLGKKASRTDMMAAAAAQNAAQQSKNNLASIHTQSSSTRSNLVQNAAPMSISGPPAFDSNA